MHCLRNPSARRQFLQLATRHTAVRGGVTTRRCYSDDGNNDVQKQEQLIYPVPPTTQHRDVASFMAYARRSGLDEKSTVYVGTHYEYTIAAHLAKYGFQLRRIGGARDRGTDLVGTWTVPVLPDEATSAAPPVSFKVLIQCKAGRRQRVSPQHIRELDGAFAGAPAGWRSGSSENGGVLGIMVCERPATKGVIEALGNSRWPMAYMYCLGTGALKQMLWNKKAKESGLAGLDVGARHVAEGTELVLMRKGKMLPFVSSRVEGI